MKIGDDLELPYAGERYRLSPGGKVHWRGLRKALNIEVTSGVDHIVNALRKLEKPAGSFRVLPGGVVATKLDKDGDGVAEHPTYVGQLKGKFSYNADINMTPAGLSPGDIWTGFYDGFRFSFSGERPWWQDSEGRRRYWTDPLPVDLRKAFVTLKPEGGQFRVTADGYIITLRELVPSIENDLAVQFDDLSDLQQKLVQYYMREFLPVDSPFRNPMMMMIPVYVGRFEGFPVLSEARDFTAPLDKGEKAAILGFLAQLTTRPGAPKFHGVVDARVPLSTPDDSSEAIQMPTIDSIEQFLDEEE